MHSAVLLCAYLCINVRCWLVNKYRPVTFLIPVAPMGLNINITTMSHCIITGLCFPKDDCESWLCLQDARRAIAWWVQKSNTGVLLQDMFYGVSVYSVSRSNDLRVGLLKDEETLSENSQGWLSFGFQGYLSKNDLCPIMSPDNVTYSIVGQNSLG